jgi:hypothetical protein
VLPFVSSAVTSRAFGLPAVCVPEPVTTNFAAAPGSTVNGALTPAIRLSPLVRVALSLTPASAFV